MPGYKPAKLTFTLAPGVAKPFPVPLKLEPEPVRLRLSSGLKSGQISLDGQPPVELQDGNFVNDAISVSNEHTFALTQAGRESLTFSFRADPGGIATLTAPVKARDVYRGINRESGFRRSPVCERSLTERRAQGRDAAANSGRRSRTRRNHGERRGCDR